MIWTVLAAGMGVAAALVLLVVWVVASRPKPSAAVANAAGDATTHVEAMRCWFQIPAERSAHCGAVVEGPAAAGVPVTVRYVVFEGGAGAAPDPIVYINGGPGSAVGLDEAGVKRWWWLTQNVAWMQGRDVVVFDQRGVGVSTPTLDCPELSEAGGRIFIEKLDMGEAARRWRDAAERCHDRLVKSGIRLEAFNTAATVADIQAMMEGLGYQSWNLYGVSYGTRVALEFLRLDDPRTRSVILDSVYPPDARAYAEAGPNARGALDLMVRRCTADPQCSAGNPRLGEQLQIALQHAGAEGYQVSVALPGAAPATASIDQGKLLESLFYGFYRWDTIRKMPAVVSALGNGDAEALAPFAGEAYATAASLDSDYGDFLSVECHDEYPFEDPAAIETAAAGLGAFRDFVMSDLPLIACPVWPVGKADAATRQPVRSATPVLLLSGEVDPITPPAWARHAAETLEHGATFVFPGVGHGVVAEHRCAGRLAAKFLAAPTEKPYDECLLALG